MVTHRQAELTTQTKPNKTKQKRKEKKRKGNTTPTNTPIQEVFSNKKEGGQMTRDKETMRRSDYTRQDKTGGQGDNRGGNGGKTRTNELNAPIRSFFHTSGLLQSSNSSACKTAVYERNKLARSPVVVVVRRARGSKANKKRTHTANRQ